jgi:hypothetical protein
MATKESARGHVLRTRAVLVAGVIDFTVGIAVLVASLGLLAWRGNRDALPLGLAIFVAGFILVLTGLGRMTARLEVTQSCVVSTWAFSRHEVALTELEDAALVEKGSPASGASLAGFLGGGFLFALVWWVVELVAALVGSQPSLGAFDLILIKRHGAPVEVKAISSWSTRHSHSQANEALRAVKAAITASTRQAPQDPRILRHDAWEN